VFFLLFFIVIAGDALSTQNISSPGYLDDRDSLNVRFVGRCDTPGYAWDVAVSGSYAYVADYYRGLRVIDVSNASSPHEVGACDSALNAVHVTVADSIVYVASHTRGMRIVNVRDPLNPVILSTFTVPSGHGIFNVEVADTIAFATSGIPCPSSQTLRVIDVSDPSAPAQIDSIPAGEGSGQHLGLRLNGDYLYINSTEAPYFRVFTAADPESVVQVGGCSLPSYPSFDIRVSGSFAYVTCNVGGVAVVDISNPAQPQVVGQMSVPSYPYSIDISGLRAFITCGSAGLRVADISDPYHPHEIGFHDTPDWAQGICYQAPYIYVACDTAGLLIYELLPTGLEETSAAGSPASLQVSPNPSPGRIEFAFNPGKEHRSKSIELQIFDISGRVVKSFSLPTTYSILHTVVWSGTDQTGRPVPSGVYFAVAEKNGAVERVKIVISR
jgi:hypothetical protein